MKFNLDMAWRDTTRLAGRNTALLSAIAGIFVFLPYAVLMLGLPAIAERPDLPEGASMAAAMAAFQTFYAKTWWAFLLAGLVVTVGILAMVALLGRQDSPTVGEALAQGARALVPTWLALFLENLLVNFAVLVPLAVAGAIGLAGLGFVLEALALALAFYLIARLSLVVPIVAVDGERNPLRALSGSWALTRGNGNRLVLFYGLLLLAGLVLIAVIMLVAGLLLTIAGPSVEELGGLLLTAAIMGAITSVAAAVLAAVHRQLRRTEGGGASVPRSVR